MSTWPIRADGSAAFNDAVAVGASGISAASTSMSYATMIANIAPSLQDGDTILFGGDGGEYTATGTIILTKDTVTIEGGGIATPIVDLLSTHRMQALDADASLFKNLILKNPNNSGIEWHTSGTGKDFTGGVVDVYVTGSSNQAFSVEPVLNDTMHIEALRVSGMNNVDDGWSMHEYASANVRWSRFAGNHQGFAGIQHSNTKFYNCVFMNNNGAGSMSGDVVLEVNEAGATMSAEFYDCIFDGAVVSNPVQNTGVPTFKAYRCKFFGYNLSNNAQVGDGVIHFGSSTAKTFNVEIDDCDFYQSIMGKRLLLIRGTASTTILNNNRIVDRIKNTQKSTFIENGATSSITNNEFRHLGTAFDNMNGAVVTDNNFIDVDTIGGTGATITNSTSKFKNNDIQVDITGIPNGSHELTLTNEGGRIIYKQQTGFAGGSVLLSTDEQVGTQLYGLVRDTLDPSNKTAPVKAVVS